MAGGFGKRLGMINQSKCLIELAGKPIIDYTIDKLKEIENLSEIVVLVNDIFYNSFVIWAKKHPLLKIRILSDGSSSENSKRGALSAFIDFLDKEEIKEDLFLAGADNFFKFSLKEIYEKFKKEQKDLAIFYDINDLEAAKRFGVAVIENNLIVDFEEKPQNPKSTLISSAMYFFKKETVSLIKELNKN